MPESVFSSDTCLLTVQDIARYLSISKSMIYKLVNDEKLPFIRIGKSLRSGATISSYGLIPDAYKPKLKIATGSSLNETLTRY